MLRKWLIECCPRCLEIWGCNLKTKLILIKGYELIYIPKPINFIGWLILCKRINQRQNPPGMFYFIKYKTLKLGNSKPLNSNTHKDPPTHKQPTFTIYLG